MGERHAFLIRVLGWCTTLAICVATPARAERLPLTTFTTANGLAGNDVSAAVEDARGFLWIGTDKGLSRFDGREFRTFGRERGLGDERVTRLVIASENGLWVGTPSGVYRFDFAHGGVFTELPVEGRRGRWPQTALAVDRHGQLWCGADGLYRLERTADGRSILRRVTVPSGVLLSYVNALAIDPEGNLWVASEQLYRRQPNGRIDQIKTGTAPGGITFLAVDPRGRVWITAPDGFSVVDRCGAAGDCRVRCVVETPVVPWTGPVWTRDGGFWVGSGDELLEFDEHERLVRRVSRAQGLVGRNPSPILRDRQGDLWIGIGMTALQRLAADGFTAFGSSEGLEAGLINSILTTRAGELVAIGHPHVVQRLDNERFTVTRPVMAPGVTDPGWGWYQIDLQDRGGEWWISTGGGLLHWSAVRRPEDLARMRPTELVAWRGCFRGQAIFRLYEDSRADLWIGTIEMGQPAVHRFNRAARTFDCFSTTSFLQRETAPTAFLDDGRGSLWIGFYEGQIARYRDGRFTCLIDCIDPSQGNITGMLLDRHRRLWVATNRAGVLRIDDIAAERPAAVRITTAEGLSSNRTRAVLEDRFDRVYIGTDLGVDVLEADGTRIRHYGVGDGLPHPFINMAQADPHGDLWFGTLNGLARLRPRPPAPAVAPLRVLIDDIRVAGVPRPVAVSGEQDVPQIMLAPDQRNLEVDFVALPRDASRTPRFQYRLADDDDWSPASSNRSVVLAGLSPGNHRLQIRSLDAGGQPSPQIATVSLRVLAPVYRRNWFLALATAGVIGLLLAAYRWRVAAATALERQRTRIAMDLHDEMGSRLGSIGLLADLAAEEAAAGTPQRTRLEYIGETASDLGSSLADIVWSLRHGSMTIEAVAQHIAVNGRRLFPGPCPTFTTRFPEQWPPAPMSLAVGRGVMLIALEALHNCLRHAKARTVTLDIRPSGRNWVLVVSDDGRGIAPDGDATSGSGFGLHTMHRRAAEIGGTLQISSLADCGTTVRLTFNPRAGEPTPHRMNIREIWNRARGIS